MKPAKPTFWGSLILTPHREPSPRRQCNGGCAGGGEINGIQCRECRGLGYFDAANPPRSKASTRTSEDVDAY
jgi:hypothetical protein